LSAYVRAVSIAKIQTRRDKQGQPTKQARVLILYDSCLKSDDTQMLKSDDHAWRVLEEREEHTRDPRDPIYRATTYECSCTVP
jgi:hypothetical protein